MAELIGKKVEKTLVIALQEEELQTIIRALDCYDKKLDQSPDFYTTTKVWRLMQQLISMK